MKLSVKALSDIGPVRERNEDMVSIAGRMLRNTSFEIEEDTAAYHYLLVADGMGGHEGGDYASQYLQEFIRDSFSMGDISAENFEAEFISCVEYASAELNAKAEYEHQEKPMGSTLCGMVWMGDRIWMVNAGDSRLYRYRDAMLEQISTDQEDEAGYLTNCVGAGVKGTPEVTDITDEVEDDDIFLICSDGLFSAVPDDEIEYILTTSPAPDEDLLDRAEVNGTTDNVSVIVARIGGGGFGDYEQPDDDGRWDPYA